MCSGGIDSQAMLWAWYKSNVPFKVVTFRYVDDNGDVYNSHDIDYIFEFAKLLNVEVEVKDFAPFPFFETEMVTYAKKYWCDSPQITLHMKLSEMITEGTVIFSGSFEMTEKLNYTILGLQRYAIKTSRPIIPFFFKYNQEIGAALYSTPKQVEKYFYDEAVRLSDNGKIQIHYLLKVRLFHYHGFPIIPQPKKYSGFEKIKDYYDKIPKLVSTLERIKYADKPSKRVFDIVFRYRLADTIGFHIKEPKTLQYYE